MESTTDYECDNPYTGAFWFEDDDGQVVGTRVNGRNNESMLCHNATTPAQITTPEIGKLSELFLEVHAHINFGKSPNADFCATMTPVFTSVPYHYGTIRTPVLGNAKYYAFKHPGKRSI